MQTCIALSLLAVYLLEYANDLFMAFLDLTEVDTIIFKFDDRDRLWLIYLWIRNRSSR